MKVREAFEAAYGDVPEGAECYIGVSHMYDHGELVPTIYTESGLFIWRDEWQHESDFVDPLGPDISDRPAFHFRGMWSEGFEYCKSTGEAYDQVISD